MLDIQQLQVSYGQQRILDQLNIQFEAGKIHGILGMNGAGKSTFFNSICGLKSIDSGSCLLDGEWINSAQIAFMQTHTRFYPFMKGIEYLDLIQAPNSNFDAAHWNKIFELPLQQLVEQYSTGMKKKLVFLGMIAQNRPVIILDEPFNGVDVESNEKMLQILTYLKEQGRIILMSSHIIHTLTACCDKVSYLKNGRFARTYTPNEFDDLQVLVQELVRQDVASVLEELE